MLAEPLPKTFLSFPDIKGVEEKGVSIHQKIVNQLPGARRETIPKRARAIRQFRTNLKRSSPF